MGSTNSTPNFKFPLFTDTDKPTWRGDVNGMSNKLESALDSVVATSNSASTLATTALGQSNDAKTAANNAVTTANNTTTTAENAKEIANSATSTATTAISTANEASTTANNAKATAESASTVANGISAKAGSALEKATTALSTVNAVEIKVDNLEKEIANSDTQWTAIPANSYASGVVPSAQPPSYRIINNIVYWSGWLNVANVNAGWTSLFSIPEVVKPAKDSVIQFVPVGDVLNAYIGAVYVGTNPRVDIYSASTKTNAAIRLGGSYPLG